MQHGLVQPPSRAISMIRCAGEATRLARYSANAWPGRAVEHGEVVMGVRTHLDDVGDRDFGAPAGDADAGAAFQVLQGGADDHRDRAAR